MIVIVVLDWKQLGEWLVQSEQWEKCGKFFNPLHNVLVKIYLTFQPRLFQSIRPIVRAGGLYSSWPYRRFLDLVTRITNGLKRYSADGGGMDKDAGEKDNIPPISTAPHWDLFIRNPMLINCYSWAFLTHAFKGAQMRTIISAGPEKLFLYGEAG